MRKDQSESITKQCLNAGMRQSTSDSRTMLDNNGNKVTRLSDDVYSVNGNKAYGHHHVSIKVGKLK